MVNGIPRKDLEELERYIGGQLKMDQKRIEDGLKRLERAVEKEELEKKVKIAEEAAPIAPTDQPVGDGILTEEEEHRQNMLLKEQYPDDICPVCHTHIVDGRYLIIPQMGAVVCGQCQNIYMPKGRYDEAVKVLEKRKVTKSSGIVAPPSDLVVPKVSV
jgi:hypothetical protein